MLELRHLRYFVAVAEELNFSRAAQRLHMAQPPLSVAIRQLEQELGVELLQRTTREVKLTDAGGTLLDSARAILADVDRAVSATRRAAEGGLGSLRVAFSWSERFETLPAIGRTFRRLHPDVALLTEEMWNARMPAALRAGELDVAVSLCPEVSSDLSYETIRSEPVLVVVADGHPFADAGSVSLSALADEEFLLFPRELAPRLFDTMIGFCRRAGFEPKLRSESFHTGWEVQTLADAPIVALIPESVSRQLPAGLVALALGPEGGEALETALVWRTGDRSAVCGEFRRVARDVFAAVRA